jgi:hypothetical protein
MSADRLGRSTVTTGLRHNDPVDGASASAGRTRCDLRYRMQGPGRGLARIIRNPEVGAVLVARPECRRMTLLADRSNESAQCHHRKPSQRDPSR